MRTLPFAWPLTWKLWHFHWELATLPLAPRRTPLSLVCPCYPVFLPKTVALTMSNWETSIHTNYFYISATKYRQRQLEEGEVVCFCPDLWLCVHQSEEDQMSEEWGGCSHCILPGRSRQLGWSLLEMQPDGGGQHLGYPLLISQSSPWTFKDMKRGSKSCWASDWASRHTVQGLRVA